MSSITHRWWLLRGCRNHTTLLWQRMGKREYAIAVAGFTVVILTFSFIISSDSSSSDDDRFSVTGFTDFVPLTFLHNAAQRGAYCLDGSVPAYHFQKGFGSGSRRWVLHIEGGGWCNTEASCAFRKTTALGSSKYMDHQVQFSGILSGDQSHNPDFYNWNKVKIRYCDGASFTGHPESEQKNDTKLFFRGQLIWEAMMTELMSVGLSNAQEALLSGCSAGGLATLIHCDDFREILPKGARVKCLSDAGFFLNEQDVAGNATIQSFYHDVVHLQGAAGSLKKDCVAKMEPSKCFFPQNFVKSINTPVFFVNPTYDFWQIKNILVPGPADRHGHWHKCHLSIHNCSPEQIEVLQGFRNSFLKALLEFKQMKDVGLMFINSCYIHCQTWISETWHGPNSPRINNKEMANRCGSYTRCYLLECTCAVEFVNEDQTVPLLTVADNISHLWKRIRPLAQVIGYISLAIRSSATSLAQVQRDSSGKTQGKPEVAEPSDILAYTSEHIIDMGHQTITTDQTVPLLAITDNSLHSWKRIRPLDQVIGCRRRDNAASGTHVQCDSSGETQGKPEVPEASDSLASTSENPLGFTTTNNMLQKKSSRPTWLSEGWDMVLKKRTSVSRFN